MRQLRYTDGTPSREFEEDWETTGQDEMNRLHAECKQKRSVLDVRDRLNNLKDLVTVCVEALIHSELNEVKLHVGHVLYFQVIEQIKTAEEELASL